MSHGTHLNESWWMSHVAHMNESCRTFVWDLSHVWMRHVTHVDASCRSYEYVTSHIWMSHATHVCVQPHMHELCRTHEWVMPHMNDLSHKTHEWVMSHIWMCHVIHMTKSSQMIGRLNNHVAFTCITRKCHMCDVTHSNTWWRDSFKYTYLNEWDICSYVWHDAIIIVTRPF